MARQNHGPLSRAKGKIGGVVFQQYEGMQISREYQPVVKNPQTQFQTTNRAEFKLASQTVGIFKEVINRRLAKFSIYARMRRGAALSAIKRVATADSGEGATVAFESVVNAINQKSLTEYGAPTVNISNENVNVTAPAESLVLGVIAGFDSEGTYVGRKIVTGTGTGTAQTFAIPSDFTAVKVMVLYAVAQTEEGRASYDNISDSSDYLNLVVERLISTGDMAVSDIAWATL